MKKVKVLFVCIHNSARSQMAEAFLNTLAGDNFLAESAGLEPGILNPVVVEAMKEIDIDISHNKTKSVQEVINQGKQFEYVITVCDEGVAQRCPQIPGVVVTQHWGLPDPSSFTGEWEEKLQQTREVRRQIKAKVEIFIKEITDHQ